MNAADAHKAADQGLHPEFRRCLIMHRWALEANSKPWDASIRQRHMMFLQPVLEVTTSKRHVPVENRGTPPIHRAQSDLQDPAELKRDRLQDGMQGSACWQNRVSSSMRTCSLRWVLTGLSHSLESGPTAGGSWSLDTGVARAYAGAL